MKSKRTRLAAAMLIGILFFITIVSLGGAENDAPPVRLPVHMWAGALTLAASFLHLLAHREWLGSVFGPRSVNLPRALRRDRFLAVGMALSGLIVGLSGTLLATNPSVIGWERLHSASGLIFIALTLAHMLLKGKWMRAAIKGLFRPRAEMETSR